jgi:UrcA family protein
LLIAVTVGSGAAAETPTSGLLVPLHVIEPAQWVVNSPGSERGEEQSFRVSYGDLDLSKAVGVSELYERLQHASEKVCRLKTRSQRTSEEYLCIRGALAKAVAEVNLLSLNELHSG